MRTDRSGCLRRFVRDVQHILVYGMSLARRLGAGCCNLMDRSSYSLVEILVSVSIHIYSIFVLRLLLCHVMICYVYNCHFAKLCLLLLLVLFIYLFPLLFIYFIYLLIVYYSALLVNEFTLFLIYMYCTSVSRPMLLSSVSKVPRHDNDCLCHTRTAKALVSPCIYTA